jgi:hypothetical protein
MMYDTNEMVYTFDDIISYSKIENVLLKNNFLYEFFVHENLYKIYLFFHIMANEQGDDLVHLDFL